MSALEPLTRWLFEDGPRPEINDFSGLAEAVRLLDELPTDEADRLAGLVEGVLPRWVGSIPALLAGAGPRGAAVLVPWLAADDEVRLCAWLFEGAPRPEVSAEVVRAFRADLQRLAAGFLGDEAARLRFAAEVLEQLDAEEDASARADADAHEDADEHEYEDAHGHGRARARWGWWGVGGLVAAAAAVVLLALLPALSPLPVLPTFEGGPESLVGAPRVHAPPSWPDAGVARPEALGETAVRPALIPVPAGTFLMGSPPGEAGRANDEPRHQVTLTRPFYLARTELTQGQWRSLMGRNPSRFQGNPEDDQRPAENMTWYEALEALNALSAAEGLPACYELGGCAGGVCARADFVGLDCPGYRLPTEAEWEYTARAGTVGATWVGELDLRDVRHAPVLDAIAWYSGNSGVERGLPCPEPEKMQHPAAQCGTHPVGRKLPNPLGFYDMLGNVWEWTQDSYSTLGDEPVVDPWVAVGDRRVTKGCDWFRDARFCRAANRYRPKPDYRSSVIGVRPARTIPAPP